MALPLVRPAAVDFSGIGNLPAQYMQAQSQAEQLRALAEGRQLQREQRAALGAFDPSGDLTEQVTNLARVGAVQPGQALNIIQQQRSQEQEEARRANIQRGLFGDGQQPGILARSGLTEQDIQAFALMDPEQALKAYQDARKGTDDIQEYNFARQQGYQGSFRDFMLEGKRAGATSITNNIGAQNDLITEGLIGADIKTLQEVEGSAREFRTLMPQMDTVISAIESGVQTGRVAEASLPLRQMAQELGFTEDPNLPAQENLAAAVAYMVPRMRVEGSGSTSDREMSTFERAIPNLKNTPEGNLLIGYGFRQIATRKQQEANLMRQYLRQNRNLDGVNDAIDRQLGPLFPKPENVEDYNNIPVGSVYVHPQKGLSVKR